LDINLNNDNNLFIELSKGLNIEKIDLMKYKILEMKKQFKINANKILISISDIVHQKNTKLMLDNFMYNVLNSTGSTVKDITVFTKDYLVKAYYNNHRNYQYLNVTEEYNEISSEISRDKIASANNNIFNKNNSLQNSGNQINLDFQINDQNVLNNFSSVYKKYNIAVINSERDINDNIKNLFSVKKWQVNTYNDGTDFITDVKNKNPDLIFLNMDLMGINAFDMLKYIKRNYSRIPVIILTSLSGKEHIIKARNLGIKYFLTKPFNTQVLLEKTEKALGIHRSIQTNLNFIMI
jgi:CheY-like chemotaxis protein